MASAPIKSGLNWYEYVGSNPTTFFDPNGQEAITIATLGGIVVKAATGAAGGALAGVTTRYVVEAVSQKTLTPKVPEGAYKEAALYGGLAGAVAGPMAGALGGGVSAGMTGSHYILSQAAAYGYIGAASNWFASVASQTLTRKKVDYTQAVIDSVYGAAGGMLMGGTSARFNLRQAGGLQKTYADEQVEAYLNSLKGELDPNNSYFAKPGEDCPEMQKPADASEIISNSQSGPQLINGTSYDVHKLYKTQSYTYRNEVESIKRSIQSSDPNNIEPIKVYVYNGQTLVVDGHHRLQAFIELGYDRIPIKYVHKNQLRQYGRTLEDLLAMI